MLINSKSLSTFEPEIGDGEKADVLATRVPSRAVAVMSFMVAETDDDWRNA